MTRLVGASGLAEEYRVGSWRYGTCASDDICAWSQRDGDPDTWEHHQSLGAARVRAAKEDKTEARRGN